MKYFLVISLLAVPALGQELSYDDYGGWAQMSDDMDDYWGGDDSNNNNELVREEADGYPEWAQVQKDPLDRLSSDDLAYGENNAREDSNSRQGEEQQQAESEPSQGPGPCHECVKEECPAPVNCLAGVTLDRCGCCLECARSEGQLCDKLPSTSALPSMDKTRFGACGDNLECVDNRESGESVCVCRVADKMACASDGKTFDTICGLNEEAARRGKPDKYSPQLIMEHWGPCKEAPVIVSPPKDSYGPLGANLTLDCEARGYPAPEISWKFVSAKGETITLPNDDQSVSIQMRGGPEPLMVTGWAQIMRLDPDYIGVYHCIATNTEGQVYAMASVGVYRKEL